MQAANATIALPMPQATFQPFSKTYAMAIIYSNRSAPVVKTTLPETSLLRTLQPCDYSDSYLTTFKDVCDEMQPADLMYAFYSAAPGWIKALIRFRSLIMTFFMLKAFGRTLRKKAALKKGSFEPGAKFGFFDILHTSESEVVFGRPGRHLDVRHSLLLYKPKKDSVQKNVLVSTAVLFHTRAGRFYFILIKPFLKYMAPFLLKRTIKRLEA